MTQSGTTWQALLRAHGYRLTPQRELVLEAVDLLGHGTPEDIHAAVAKRSTAVNISTVYRTLTLLDELGLVRHVFLSDRTPVYHSKATASHVHLSCRDCGQVLDAEPSDFLPLAATLIRKHAFDIDLERVVMPGWCSSCREASPPNG